MASVQVRTPAGVRDSTEAQDASPLESQREWQRQAEDNLLSRLERGGLLAPAGELDGVLATVVNNHDWPDTECTGILRRCREQMRSADRLLIVEMVPVPGQPNAAVSLIDIGMMTFAGEARQRTSTEYAELFTATQFQVERVLPTDTSFSVIEAKPV
ncbi:MAG: hypothetical protein M3Z32_09325 [Acidobacteriota bacterium]|nr:hypothetical protein [Acidobacteriota bacterium]